jgi:hypothetical protein
VLFSRERVTKPEISDLLTDVSIFDSRKEAIPFIDDVWATLRLRRHQQNGAGHLILIIKICIWQSSHDAMYLVMGSACCYRTSHRTNQAKRRLAVKRKNADTQNKANYLSVWLKRRVMGFGHPGRFTAPAGRDPNHSN